MEAGPNPVERITYELKIKPKLIADFSILLQEVFEGHPIGECQQCGLDHTVNAEIEQMVLQRVRGLLQWKAHQYDGE